MATRFPIETDQPVIEVTLPVGRHVLELVVEDSAGLRSAPDTVVITVQRADAVAVAIAPVTAALIAGAQQQFAASVTGTTNTAVVWSVQESGGGAVSTTGLYTAPASAGTYHVRATSVADPTKSASATVTVTAAIAVNISPSAASLATGGTQQFTAKVTGTTNTTVNWMVTERDGGTVSATGLYTAPDTAGTYHVRATSAADTSKSDIATVTVTAIDICTSARPTVICTGATPTVVCSGATPTIEICTAARPTVLECVSGAPTDTTCTAATPRILTCTGSSPTIIECVSGGPSDATVTCTAAKPTVVDCVVGGPTNTTCTGAAPRILECTGATPTIIRSEPERASMEKPEVKPKGKPKK